MRSSLLPERRDRQADAIDPEHGDVGGRILAHQRGGHVGAVGEGHGDPVGAVHDVLVGDDHAVGAHHEAGAEALDLLLVALGGEEHVEGRLLHPPAPDHTHRHDGGATLVPPR